MLRTFCTRSRLTPRNLSSIVRGYSPKYEQFQVFSTNQLLIPTISYKVHDIAIYKMNHFSTEKSIDQKPEQELSKKEKLKRAIKDYGAVVLVFHISISLISLGTCYFLVSTGLDVPQTLSTLGLGEWFEKDSKASNAGTFAVAYAIHKVFAPVRLTITLGSLPFLVRYFRKIGYLKK